MSDEIRVLDVGPGIGHRAAAERWAQTGHRRAVSDARLIIEYQNPGAAHDFIGAGTPVSLVVADAAEEARP